MAVSTILVLAVLIGPLFVIEPHLLDVALYCVFAVVFLAFVLVVALI